MKAERESNKIELSILIPVYNAERYLTQCLDSIRNQDFVSYEVILVNDGSNDKSAAICEAYVSKDERFQLVHQTNQGFGAARNTGLKHARGTYLYFMDSDDILVPGLFSRILPYFKEHGYDTIFFGFQKIYVSASAPVTFDMIPPAIDCRNPANVLHDLAHMLLRGFGFGVWQQIFRRDFLVASNVSFPTLKREADVAYLLDLYKNLKSFKTVPEVFYLYQAFYSPHKNNPDILRNHMILYRLLVELLWPQRHERIVTRILRRYLVLWFCHVIPLHIYLNPNLSRKAKIAQFGELLAQKEFLQWRKEAMVYPGSSLEGVALTTFGLRSPVVAYYTTAINHFLKYKLRVNYKKIYYGNVGG